MAVIQSNPKSLSSEVCCESLAGIAGTENRNMTNHDFHLLLQVIFLIIKGLSRGPPPGNSRKVFRARRIHPSRQGKA
jgi:hypothetical protein